MARPTPERPDVRLVVTTRTRLTTRLDPVEWPQAADPPIPELVEHLGEVPDAWGWTLSGGEPTLRSDLPQLIRAVADAEAPNLGLATDGFALVSPRVAGTLVDAGLQRVRIGLHSARADAHDWLAGASGATRRVRKAIEACSAAGLVVEVETVVTRPVMPLLEEIVLLASALGARALHFRRPRLDGPRWRESVSLSPRFGLLQPWLEGATQAAWRRGMRVTLHDFPACAAPSKGRFRAGRGTERWLLGPELEELRAALEPTSTTGCASCPSSCGGAPADYVARFGRTEFDSEGSAGEPVDSDEGGPVPVPAPRAGWSPATRVATARHRASAGRPGQPHPGSPDDRLTLDLAPGTSTREARMLLVRAAQQRPRVLRLVGGWSTHDKGAGLLAETRYFEAEVEVVGEVDRLASLPNRALKKLGRLVRVDAVLRGPDAATHDEAVNRTGAFDATIALLPRLREAGIAARLCADPGSAAGSVAFDEAWSAGTLPGEPAWIVEE